jgi:hypothetical protein
MGCHKSGKTVMKKALYVIVLSFMTAAHSQELFVHFDEIAHLQQITWYRRQVPVTRGSEKSCKKSDEVIVAVKCMKVHGAKDRNTNAFPEGKHT